jgi:uncharacterized membrane protein
MASDNHTGIMQCMTAVLLALLTFVGWGTGDIFGAITSRRIGSLKASLAITGFLTLFLLALAPFMNTEGVDMSVILQSLALGLAIGTAYLAFVEALRIGNPAIVGTISGSFTALTVILSLLFLGETLGVGQLFFIATIVIGVTGASLDIRSLRERKVRMDKSVVLSLITMAGWGVYFTFMKVPIRDAGWFWPTLISIAASWLLYVAVFAIKKKLHGAAGKKPRQGLAPAFITAIVGGGANVTYNIALSYGNVSIVAPIAGSYLILFVVLAARVFKEPLTHQQTAGIAISLCGIVGLAVLSS